MPASTGHMTRSATFLQTLNLFARRQPFRPEYPYLPLAPSALAGFEEGGQTGSARSDPTLHRSSRKTRLKARRITTASLAQAVASHSHSLIGCAGARLSQVPVSPERPTWAACHLHMTTRAKTTPVILTT